MIGIESGPFAMSQLSRMWISGAVSLAVPVKTQKLSAEEEKIVALLWNGSYSAADVGRSAKMSEDEATYHLGRLEKKHLVHVPIVINGEGTAHITQEGREHVCSRTNPKSVEIEFPDGETQGGVDLLILKIRRKGGEEAEQNLLGAIGHNPSTTNRYITFAI
jgi:DNA-binding CsgD family transcriptional regulator